MARILRDAGAEIVASVYTFGTCGNFKGIVDGKWSWEPIDPAWVDDLDLSTRRKAIAELAKIVLGWPTWQGVRSYWALEINGRGRWLTEYKADGLLLAPTRSCETDFRNGYIAMQRIFKRRNPDHGIRHRPGGCPEDGSARLPNGKQSCSCISWKRVRKEVHENEMKKGLIEAIIERFRPSPRTPMNMPNPFRGKGRLLAGYMCTHVPEEILYAAGIVPVRILSSHVSQAMTRSYHP